MTKNPELWSGSLERAARLITKTAALEMNVERCGLWLYSEGRDHIRCTMLYICSDGSYHKGANLFANQYPSYFKALEEERVIAVSDAAHDLRTQEFADSYLKETGVVSMLDAPVLCEGRISGVLCLEHKGELREWSPVERSLAASFGYIAAQAMEAARLRESEKQLETAQSIAKIGSWVWEVESGEMQWSDQLFSIFGLERRSTKPGIALLLDATHQEDQHGLSEALQCAKSGTPFRLQHRIVTADDEVRHVESAGFLGDEETTRVFGTCQDVTKLFNAMQEAEARKQGLTYFRRLFGQTPHLIFTVDRDLFVTDINRTEPGLTREMVIGRHVSEFTGPNSKDVVLDLRARVDQAGETQSFEVSALGAYGEMRWYEGYMSPIEEDDGESRYIVTAIDVTENRRLRDELTKIRTLEAIGRVTGGIVHDFNNVTMAIKGYAELALQAVKAQQDPVPLLERVLRSSNKAKALIRRIPRPGSTATHYRASLDLNQAVETFVGFISPLLGEEVEVTFEPSPEPQVVDVDPTHLERILLNLCVNARQAMSTGGRIKLTVEHCAQILLPRVLAGVSTSQEGAVICVEDDGPGIPEGMHQQIFEPFFTTRKSNSGTGLGLFVCTELAEKNGGSLQVDETFEGGAMFKLHLPISTRPPDWTGERDDSDTNFMGTETVLVVDDDPDVLGLMRFVLNTCGYDVLVASSGEEALDIFLGDDDRIKLVVTDYQMGNMSGTMLAQELREVDPELPMILISAFAQQQEEAVQVLFDEFMHKPISPQQFTRKVRALLDRRVAPGRTH